jgi:cytochrome c-type biogenesis protein CcmE
MAQTSWEKTAVTLAAPKRLKFAIAGVLLLGAIAFLLVSGTAAGSQYFLTVDDMLTRPDLAGKTVRISGAVVGSTIRFDADTKTIHFTIANVTDDMNELEKNGGLAEVLHKAVIDPKARRLDIVVSNQAMPDLLKDEAQAIVSGQLGSDGVFRANELLLKCPSKYTSDVPQQSQ